MSGLKTLFNTLSEAGVPMPGWLPWVANWLPQGMQDSLIGMALPDSISPLHERLGSDKMIALASPLIGGALGGSQNGSGGGTQGPGMMDALAGLAPEQRAVLAQVLTRVPPQQMNEILADVPADSQMPAGVALLAKGGQLAQAAGLTPAQTMQFTGAIGALSQSPAGAGAPAAEGAATDPRTAINRSLAQLRGVAVPLSEALHGEGFTDQDRQGVSEWIASPNFVQGVSDLKNTQGWFQNMWNRGTTLDGGADIAATAAGGLGGGMLMSRILGGVLGSFFGQGGQTLGNFIGFFLGAFAGGIGAGAIFGNSPAAAAPAQQAQGQQAEQAAPAEGAPTAPAAQAPAEETPAVPAGGAPAAPAEQAPVSPEEQAGTGDPEVDAHYGIGGQAAQTPKPAEPAPAPAPAPAAAPANPDPAPAAQTPPAGGGFGFGARPAF